MSDFKPRAVAYCPVCGRYVPFEKPRLAKVVYEKSICSRGGIGTCQGLMLVRDLTRKERELLADHYAAY